MVTSHEELRRLKTDLFDGTPWKRIAEFLCRSGSANEVRRMAAELRLGLE